MSNDEKSIKEDVDNLPKRELSEESREPIKKENLDTKKNETGESSYKEDSASLQEDVGNLPKRETSKSRESLKKENPDMKENETGESSDKEDSASSKEDVDNLPKREPSEEPREPIKRENLETKKNETDESSDKEDSASLQEDEGNIPKRETSDKSREPLKKENLDIKENETGESSDKEDSASSKKSSRRARSADESRLRFIFVRPRFAEPRHPIFSSQFARHISKMAFGPKKPKWYTPLTSAQLYLFKDMMNYVEIGRETVFRFDDFMEALQDFEPSISRAEVLEILEIMDKNEFEELDFGKFLFLLAFRDHPLHSDEPDEVNETLSSPVVTPRQCLILSAISYYVLIASPEEIERYYIANTRRKATVLHHHMESSRLQGLTEKQMEYKQKKAMLQLGPLFAITGSPYAYPVPFVPSFKKGTLSKKWSKRRRSTPRSAVPVAKKPVKRPITPIKQSRELGEEVRYKTKDDKTYYDMHYGRLPMPMLSIPENIRAEMRKKCTVELKDYITQKAYEAVGEYRHRLRKATVLYNKRSLDTIRSKGFPTLSEEEDFIELFERYMPLQLNDVKNFSLWVRPAGYQTKHLEKSTHSDKYAFGSKIP